jgi:hypothetical protein
MNDVIIVEAPTLRWIECDYDGRRRLGLDLGDDPRPGTNNRAVYTLDGYRTFRKDKMFLVEDVTTLPLV